MYIETLQTPHPANQDSAIEPEPFVDAAGLAEARQYLAEQDYAGSAVLGVVDHVTDTVRDSIRYYRPKMADKVNARQELFAFDAIEGLAKEQTTRCGGFAMVGSESLEAVGIEHYVGYMSDHWFLLVPHERNGRQCLRLADMYKPGRANIEPITQDIENGLSRPGVDGFVEALRQGGPAATMLDFAEFAANLGEMPATWNDGNYRWLDPYKQSAIQRPNVKQAFIMVGYAPEEGRRIARRKTEFQTALARGELDEAAFYLSQIAGRYPEINARAPHTDIGSLVMGLCACGRFERAGQAIDDYFGYAHSISHDPRLSTFEGDLWRHVSVAAIQAGITMEGIKDRAQTAYEAASQRTAIQPYQAMCVGKMATL